MNDILDTFEQFNFHIFGQNYDGYYAKEDVEQMLKMAYNAALSDVVLNGKAYHYEAKGIKIDAFLDEKSILDLKKELT